VSSTRWRQRCARARRRRRRHESEPHFKSPRREGEGRGWLRNDLEEGGRYVGIPPAAAVRCSRRAVAANAAIMWRRRAQQNSTVRGTTPKQRIDGNRYFSARVPDLDHPDSSRIIDVLTLLACPSALACQSACRRPRASARSDRSGSVRDLWPGFLADEASIVRRVLAGRDLAVRDARDYGGTVGNAPDAMRARIVARVV
jgi:hypothetical protein